MSGLSSDSFDMDVWIYSVKHNIFGMDMFRLDNMTEIANLRTILS